MSRSRIYYLRVTEREVIPVEIQSVGSSSDSLSSWLRDKHIQEILQLLQGTIESFIELKRNKSTCIKQHQKPSDIVTGNSVRFGYMFKQRPSGQTCLIEEPSNNCRLKSFHVLKDKVVVLAHPLAPGSPNRMSQLMKVLNRKRHSTGQGVGISSYFKKIPSKTVSENISDSQSNTQESSVSQSDTLSQNSQEMDAKENQSETGLQEAATNDGHRNKIKDILKRGEIGLSRRHKRKHQKQLDHHLRQDADDESNEGRNTDENIINSRVCQQEIESNNKHLNVDKNFVLGAIDVSKGRTVKGAEAETNEQSTTEAIKDVSVPSFQSPPFREGSNESFMLGDVQVSLVDNPCINLDCNEEKQGDSITIISVKQMNDIEKEKSQTQSSEEQFSNNQSDSGDEILGNQSDAPSNSSSEMLALPSASFITKGAKRRSSAIDMKMLKNYFKSYDADVDSDSVKDSPNRKTQSESETVKVGSDCRSDEETTREGIGNQFTVSEMKDPILKSSNGHHKAVHKHKLKRKFPKFSSDSDSDTNIPVKKTKRSSEKLNFVSLENMKSNSKTIQISKSFFSTDGGKSQPTLSSFMSGKKSGCQHKKSTLENKSPQNCVDIDLEEGDVVIEHIDFPKVKNELDVDLRKEIQTISSIGRLNDEHLQYLIRSNEKYLRGIFGGKIHCKRHQEFKKGGKSRRDLNYNSRLCQYSEEQVDTVMESLMAIFCKRHHKYLDYIMKVLLPEMLIKIHMDVNGTGHDESEKIIATQPGKVH